MKLVILNLTNQTVHYVSHPLSEVFYLPRPRGRSEMAFSPPTWLRNEALFCWNAWTWVHCWWVL